MNSSENLIIELSKKEPSRPKLIKAIAKSLGCTDRSVYNKLQGNSGFTLNEAEKLMEYFDINSELIFKNKRNYKTRINDESPSEYIIRVLEKWQYTASKFLKTPNAELYSISNGLPNTLIFGYKHLVRLRLYLSVLFAFQNDRVPKYDMTSTLFHGIEPFISSIAKNFDSISSTCIWNNETIISTLSVIKQLESRDLISIPASLSLFEELKSLLYKAENYAIHGHKQENKSSMLTRVSPRFDLYWNDAFSSDSYLIVLNQNDSEEQLEIFNPLFGILEMPDQKEAIKNYVLFLTDSSEYLSRKSIKELKMFFDKKREQINHYIKEVGEMKL